MKTNTLIRVDGSTKGLPDGELSLEQMYEAIGCTTVEHVGLTESEELWCDEEGLLVAEPVINPIATDLYRKAYPHIDPQELGIVGNAILTRTK